MADTVVGLFREFEGAQRAVDALTQAGFRHEEISLAAGRAFGSAAEDSEPERAVGQDAGVGAGVGGVIGLLVGLAALTVPGIGPVLAAGPLATALGAALGSTVIGAGVGAVTGGLTGSLTHFGIETDQAEYYAAGVRHGGTLVIVHPAPDQTAAAQAILQAHGGQTQREDQREAESETAAQ